MEANFFRTLALELEKKLVGMRIQKLYEPYPNIYTLKLSAASHLILVRGKKKFLFWSSSKPDNPWQPSSYVQFLRKRIRGAKIVSALSDWPRRIMALELSPRADKKWLLLDLNKGLFLTDVLPEEFKQTVLWPSLEGIISNGSEIYQHYPQISPVLRKTLLNLPPEQGKALLENLRSGLTPSKFYFYKFATGFVLLNWPIPEPLKSEPVTSKMFSSVLQAAEFAGWQVLRTVSGQDIQRARLLARLKKKIKHKMTLLDNDLYRMKKFLSHREEALLLQANLHTLKTRAKTGNILLKDWTGQERVIQLDKSLDLVQNMEKMFRLAQKGKRGLAVVEQRRRLLSDLLLQVEQGILPAQEQLRLLFKGDYGLIEPGKKPLAKNKVGLSSHQAEKNSRNKQIAVHCFLSSDGFRILRGKNQKANHQLLTRLAKPFDLWFHAYGGPGAHVILKKEFRTQNVPRTTMIEAAVLAANASYLSQEGNGDVICALVKDLRKIKGGGLGEVIVGQVLETLRVSPKRELEDRLAKE